mgnify:CR=1 FL=1
MMSLDSFVIPFQVASIEKGYTFVVRGFEGKGKKISLYASDNKNANILLETTLDVFDIEMDKVLIHPLFQIEIEEKKYIVGERTLPVEGMNNFRDMGGYETYDGSFVKWGLLYRSDHIHNATEKGVEYLKKLDIHTIIDYRSPDEQSKYPNKVINENIKTYSLDPDAHTAELAAQFTSNKENEDENLVRKIISQKENGALVNRYDIVMAQYLNFVNKDKCKDAFSSMIKIIADVGIAPVDQHCRGGKDRTGYGCMLLLGLLGVKKEYIIYDYMLTHYNRIERNSIKMEKYKKFTQDQDVLDYLYSLIDTQPEFIDASYDDIINKYGSVESYAMIELGITAEEIQNLKNMYLEK